MDHDRRRQWSARHAGDTTIAPPSPFVGEALAVLGPPAAMTRALDLACGRGRHALLLAEHGFRVDAVDYAPAALVTAQAAARARGLTVTCIAADVTTWPLPVGRYAVVVVVNFLERALLEPIRRAVAPGGALLYETFRRDEDPSRQAMRPDFLLAPGELEHVCRDWAVLLRHDAVVTHDGRPVARAGILARRPRADRDAGGQH